MHKTDTHTSPRIAQTDPINWVRVCAIIMRTEHNTKRIRATTITAQHTCGCDRHRIITSDFFLFCLLMSWWATQYIRDSMCMCVCVHLLRSHSFCIEPSHTAPCWIILWTRSIWTPVRSHSLHKHHERALSTHTHTQLCCGGGFRSFRLSSECVCVCFFVCVDCVQRRDRIYVKAHCAALLQVYTRSRTPGVMIEMHIRARVQCTRKTCARHTYTHIVPSRLSVGLCEWCTIK